MTLKYNIKYFFIFAVLLTLFTTAVVKAEGFEATLGWSKRVELSSPVNGVVHKVFAESGKIVAKGEVLVQLDPRIFKANLKYAKAKLKNTNEHSLETKRELDRQLDMYDRSMLSEHDLQVAKNNFSSAQALSQQAQASLTKAKLNLEYSAIRAPFNAVVVNSVAIKGQIVAAELSPPTLVIVAEAQRMLARFYAATDKANSFVINQGVEVNVAGKSYQGRILNIALEPDRLKLGHYAVDVIFDLNDKILRAGQKATIEL